MINGEYLEINNKKILLPGIILDHIRVAERHVVLLDLSKPSDQNALCFDLSGNLIWTIEPAPNIDGYGSDTWIQLYPLNDQFILARNKSGIEIQIDLIDGKMVRGTGHQTK